MKNLNLTFASLNQLKNYEDNFLQAKKLKTHAFAFVSLEELKNKYTSLFFSSFKKLKIHESDFLEAKNSQKT